MPWTITGLNISCSEPSFTTGEWVFGRNNRIPLLSENGCRKSRHVELLDALYSSIEETVYGITVKIPRCYVFCTALRVSLHRSANLSALPFFWFFVGCSLGRPHINLLKYIQNIFHITHQTVTKMP